jgi:hypothetical protein
LPLRGLHHSKELSIGTFDGTTLTWDAGARIETGILGPDGGASAKAENALGSSAMPSRAKECVCNAVAI